MKKETDKVFGRFSGKGVFPHQWAFTLLIPLRNIFLSPKKLIARLDLQENYQVLEIGPGPGYFSTEVAKFLSKGRLVLADIQQEMLTYAKKRIDKKGLQNVEYKLCNGKTLDFESEEFNRVFMVTVIGEVENKEEYLIEIRRILRNEGQLSISELAGDPDKLSQSELINLVTSSGFQVYKIYGSAKNYTINFIKEKNPSL